MTKAVNFNDVNYALEASTFRTRKKRTSESVRTLFKVLTQKSLQIHAELHS